MDTCVIEAKFARWTNSGDGAIGSVSRADQRARICHYDLDEFYPLSLAGQAALE